MQGPTMNRPDNKIFAEKLPSIDSMVRFMFEGPDTI